MSARKKGAVLSYLLMVVEVFSGLFFTPFLIRSFGQAEYGVYSLVFSVTSYLTLLDLGVGNAIIRYMAKYRILKDEQKQREFMSLILVFYTAIALLVIGIGFILRRNMSTVFGVGLSAEELKRAQVMFMITVFSSALTFATTPFSKVLYAFERFTVLKTMDIIRLLVRVSISFLLLYCGGKGIAMVTLNFILNIIFSFATVICYIAEVKIKPVFGKIDLRFVKEIAAYSGLIFVQMIATQLNKMADQVLMGMMVASSSVIIGVYAIGAQITQYFESISSAVNGVLMPGVVRMVETGASGKDLEEEMVRIGRLLFMFLSIIYLVFLLFGHDFIKLWAGNENEQAYYVAAIIMFPMLFHLSQAIGQQILWAKNKHKNQALLQVAIAAANVVFTILLIRWNPLFGATIATGITYFVGNVVLQNCFFKKHIGISVASYYKGLFRGIWLCLLFSAIGGASMHLFGLQGWFGFAVNCTVMCVIYAVTMLAFGMTQAEKGIIFAVVRKCKNFLKRK